MVTTVPDYVSEGQQNTLSFESKYLPNHKNRFIKNLIDVQRPRFIHILTLTHSQPFGVQL